jgi:hypothetical protein
VADGTQPINGAWDRELCCSEPFDDVPTSAPAGFLHDPQHLVNAGEATGDSLGIQGASGEYPVALEEGLGPCVRPAGRVGLGYR